MIFKEIDGFDPTYRCVLGEEEGLDRSQKQFLPHLISLSNNFHKFWFYVMIITL